LVQQEAFVIPADRIRVLDDTPERDGDWVLYWMIAARRPHWNFALQRAVERAESLGKALVVLEPLRVGHRWASDRFHRFVLDGMLDNHRSFGGKVAYHPYVESSPGAGKGLLAALARRACLVVTDDFPGFFLPRMVSAAASTLDVRLELVDGNGLLPVRSTERAFTTAASFRRHLQKVLVPHLEQFPDADPLANKSHSPLAQLPAEVLARWPAATADLDLSALPIDHSVKPAPVQGGHRAAQQVLASFIDGALGRCGAGRNHPDDDASSGLSPYLHFGHISAHQVFARVADQQLWDLHLPRHPTGKREGWWGMSPSAEAFLDELVTWRELALNGAAHLPDHDSLAGNPAWARTTLEQHRSDPRPVLYSLDELARGETHDPLWNAAQRELAQTGRMQGYLRMLWGKHVLAWSETSTQAFERLVELNNRFALDGRDPNSISGIAWVFGRYDRAWGPERAVFGKVRYMTSQSAQRKLRLRNYLERWGGA
jgi:deoxyribodipyrimidine photo-lyase